MDHTLPAPPSSTPRKQTKSERTREAILASARALFAEKGYEGATVRDIAARAAIDPAMVIRYFGGKDALFAEAAEIELHLPDLAAVPRETIGVALVRHFLAIWERGSASGGMPVALRSAASNEQAAARLRSIFADQVMPAIMRSGVDDPVSVAGLVSTHLLGLAFCRYVLKLGPIAAMPQDRIVEAFGRSLQGIFDAAWSRPAPAAGKGS